MVCGFNTLLPALVFKLRIFASYSIGPLDTGISLSDGNGIGTLTSMPGYNLTVNATTIHMDDFTSKAQGQYLIDARGLLKTDDGAIIGVHAEGLFADTPHIQAILANETDVQGTKWGEVPSPSTWTFDASGKYQGLMDSRFVANFRISPSDNVDTVAYAEYRLSKVMPGPLCED